MIVMLWVLSAAAGILAWLLWLFRDRPDPVAPERSDPFAAEVAVFRRELGDWCRG